MAWVGGSVFAAICIVWVGVIIDEGFDRRYGPSLTRSIGIGLLVIPSAIAVLLIVPSMVFS